MTKPNPDWVYYDPKPKAATAIQRVWRASKSRPDWVYYDPRPKAATAIQRAWRNRRRAPRGIVWSKLNTRVKQKIVGFMKPVRQKDRVTEKNPRGVIPRYQMTSWDQYDMAMEALKLRNQGRGKRRRGSPSSGR